MKVTVLKLTGVDLLRRSCQFTSGKPSKVTREAMYQCEHSPIRTQIFWVEMFDIPTFVSVHMVRHNIGITHFVRSNRDDISFLSGQEVTRETPVDHAMLVNAQALINMARKRLCNKAHERTREVMQAIKTEVAKIECDPYLAKFMVKECDYRGGFCPENTPCGRVQL